jgi:hypothetical protein
METRLSITIEKKLLDSAVLALNARSKAEAVRLALQEAVRRKRLETALSHAGNVALDVTVEELERLRDSE